MKAAFFIAWCTAFFGISKRIMSGTPEQDWAAIKRAWAEDKLTPKEIEKPKARRRALPRALIGRYWFYVRPEEAAALYPFLDPVSGMAFEERTCGRPQEKRRRE